MRPLRAFVAALAVLLALSGPVYAAEPAMVMRFDQQQQTATPIDDPVLLDSESALTLSNFFFYETPILDVRAFNSYGIEMRLENGTMTATDLIEVSMEFYADSAGTTLLFSETYVLFKTNLGGSGRLRLTDQMHGAYLKMWVSDYLSVNRTVQLTYQLYGSYRPMANAYLRSSDDSLLFDVFRALAAAANDGGDRAKLAYGQAMVRLVSDQVPVTLDIRYNGTNVNSIKYTLTATVANTAVEKIIILPRSQMFVTITNNAAAAANIRAQITQLVQPF